MQGDTIRKLRKLKGLSITELSKILEIDRGYLSHIEQNDISNPSFDIISNICASLELTLDEFIEQIKKDNRTLEIFDKIFDSGMNIDLLTKEHLLKCLYENKYLNEFLKIYENDIKKI